jgi:hypothetical protein
MRAGARGRCYHTPTTVLGAGEVKIVLGFEIEKERTIHISYDCIQIVTISAVGECAE